MAPTFSSSSSAPARLVALCLTVALLQVAGPLGVAAKMMKKDPLIYASALLMGDHAASKGVASLIIHQYAPMGGAFTIGLQNISKITMIHIHQYSTGTPLLTLVPTGVTADHFVLADPPFNIGYNPVFQSVRFNRSYLALGQASLPGYTWEKFIADIKSGNNYVNVHTVDYPAGITNGTLLPLTFNKPYGGYPPMPMPMPAMKK